MEASVENTGFASAKNVSIAMNWNGPDNVHANSQWMTIDNGRYRQAFARSTDLHPGFCSTFMFFTEWTAEKREIILPASGANEYRPKFTDLEIDYFVFAENFEPQKHRVVFSQDDLVLKTCVEKKSGISNFR